ncbi:hypothetical protein [Aeromonas veronii]|uniref:hypothetical protein n=1 Tax=Aeromonas veronii TaxID=654 RepID=UPI0032EF5A24
MTKSEKVLADLLVAADAAAKIRDQINYTAAAMTYTQHVRAVIANLDLDSNAYTGHMAEAIEMIRCQAHEPQHNQLAAVCEFAFSQFCGTFADWFEVVDSEGSSGLVINVPEEEWQDTTDDGDDFAFTREGWDRDFVNNHQIAKMAWRPDWGHDK